MKFQQIKKYILLFLLFISAKFLFAQIQLPDDFYETTVSSGWDAPVGFEVDETGQMYVSEKPGRLHVVDTNGVKLSEPLLDIREEVASYIDLGMLGFVLDPDFRSNGYFYVLYVVDGHHLRNFGTPEYDPNISTENVATIGRVTRFQADAATNFTSLVPDSRKVLIGESMSTGIPVMHLSHSLGTLLFGTDGTLLVSTGDGTTFFGHYTGTANAQQNPEQDSYAIQGLADGILTPKEDIGAFRSQLIDSHNGKVLRINPETGDGIASNPFFDANAPRAPRSRVWALGFRNAYRMTLRPETGSHFEADANPGVLYIGDVGRGSWEELNVATQGGLNFGWPLFEGMNNEWDFYNKKIQNQDAPNPLYDGNACADEFIDFQDLTIQATLNDALFPNPCDNNQFIPDGDYLFVHTRASLSYANINNPFIMTDTYTPAYDDMGNALALSLIADDSPIESDTFSGFANLGGTFYTGDKFPEDYREPMYVLDYSGWIKRFYYNENQELTRIEPFAENAGRVLHLAVNPHDGCLYYFRNQEDKMYKICYGGNPPPVAVAEANVYYGASPLTVDFDGSASFDPNGLPLSFSWNFDDGTVVEGINPSHEFVAPDSNPYSFNVELTVTDSLGAVGTDAFIISLNNTPPQVDITSFEDGDTYPISGTTLLPLIAEVIDNEHTESELSYEWQTILHHNTHFHTDPINTAAQTSTLISPLGCSDENYYYEIKLRVTDAAGLTGEDSGFLFPNCNPPFFEMGDFWATDSEGKVTLDWTTLMENNTAYFEVHRSIGDFNFSPIGTVDAIGNSDLVNNYQFIDTQPMIGVNAYRLKIFDNDGNYEYSKIVYVEYNNLPDLHVFPNPTRDFVNFSFNNVNEQATFSLYNYLGQRMYENTQTIEGKWEFTLSLINYPAGVYIYSMDDGDEVKTGKLVVR